jgi:hypothetical protein
MAGGNKIRQSLVTHFLLQLITTNLIHLCSCDDAESATSSNVTGKIILCYAPADAKEKPPRVALPNAISLAIKVGAEGLIFATYSSNLIDWMTDCEGTMPCVLVDFEVAQRIVSYIEMAG